MFYSWFMKLSRVSIYTLCYAALVYFVLFKLINILAIILQLLPLFTQSRNLKKYKEQLKA